MKRLLALVLALVMALVMMNAVSAEPAKTFETNYEGKTVILHTNDVHGAIAGYAYIPALRAWFEDKGADVIVVDAGDFSQGTTYVSSSKGAAAVEMMNAAGYDIVTLGNHEFDFGYDQLMANLENAEFTAICANVILDENGESILPMGTVYKSEAIKIAFIGVETPETATKVHPGLIKNIHFTTFADLYTYTQAAIDFVKADEPDLVIALTHLGVDKESAANGYRSVDLLANVEGIDSGGI